MPSPATRLAAQALRLLPRERFSRAVGWLSDLEGPTPLVEAAVRAFTAVYGVDLGEVTRPPGGWRSFDAFFTRPLQPGARPFPTEAAALASPADGRVLAAGALEPGAVFHVKGTDYRVEELLADPDAPRRFEGGSAAIVYLSPPDYHRVHAVAEGAVARVVRVPGERYPVNAVGTALIPRLFEVNERAVVEQDGADGRRWATVLVGAVGVGRIGLAFDEGAVAAAGPGAPVVLGRGAELGVFHLGSTVVLLVDAPVAWARGPGDRVRAGEVLGWLGGERRT